jgi:hypothetical protein
MCLPYAQDLASEVIDVQSVAVILALMLHLPSSVMPSDSHLHDLDAKESLNSYPTMPQRRLHHSQAPPGEH